MARRTKKRGNSRSVDFSQQVKDFEPDSEYELEVKAVTWEDGEKGDYLAFIFKGTDEDNEDAELYHNASVSPKALSRTRSLLEALGYEIEDGATIDIDTEELVGMRCMAHTFEDEYRGTDGQKRQVIRADDFWPVEKSKKSGGKKSSKKDTIAKSEVEDMDDRDDLVELIERFDLKVNADSRKLKKDDDALKEAIIEALEEGDHLEEDEPKGKSRGERGSTSSDDDEKSTKKRGKDDDEDEPKGKSKKGDDKSGRSRRGSGKSKKQQTWKADAIQEMNEDELQEVVDESGVDFDLDDHKSLRKKKNALIDALEEADMIEADD